MQEEILNDNSELQNTSKLDIKYVLLLMNWRFPFGMCNI